MSAAMDRLSARDVDVTMEAERAAEATLPVALMRGEWIRTAEPRNDYAYLASRHHAVMLNKEAVLKACQVLGIRVQR